MRTLTKLGEIKAFKHYALGNKDLAGLFAGNKSQILTFLPHLGTDSWVRVSPQSRDTVHIYTDPHLVWTHSCLTAATPAKPIPSVAEASRNTATLQLPAAEGTGINQRGSLESLRSSGPSCLLRLGKETYESEPKAERTRDTSPAFPTAEAGSDKATASHPLAPD